MMSANWVARMPHRSLGRLCIDFVLSGGLAERSVWETLHSPADLSDWLAECRLEARGIEATQDDLHAAVELREAVWFAARAAVDGEPVPSESRRALNRAAAGPPLVPSLDTEGRLSWQQPTARAGLSHIARDMLDLLADSEQRARLRECEAPDCGIVFYDDSRPGTRRWCAPARCGDRNRARAYRARRRSERE